MEGDRVLTPKPRGCYHATIEYPGFAVSSKQIPVSVADEV